jgi:hypothetical protein
MILAPSSRIHTRQLRERQRTRAHEHKHQYRAVDERHGPALSNSQRKGSCYAGPAVANDPSYGYGFDARHVARIVGLDGEVDEARDQVLDLARVGGWDCFGFVRLMV